MKSNRFCYNISGYTPVHLNRSGKTRGGGICWYIDERLNFNLIHSAEFMNSYEIVLHLPDFNINVGGIYRDPSCSNNIYLEHLDKLFEKYRKCIWMGDFNYDLLNNNFSITCYKNILNCNSLIILNKINNEAATYFHSSSGCSILDHAITDLTNYQFRTSVVSAGFSDHNALFVTGTNLTTTTSPKNFISRRTDYLKLNRLVPAIIKKCKSSVDNLIRTISDSITACTSSRPARPNDDHWINQEIKKLMYERDRYKRLHQKFSNNLHYSSNYRRLKNLVTAKIRDAKKTSIMSNFNHA